MQKNSKIIFIHGYTASHLADWYPAITPMLQAEGWDLEIPDLPGGEHPHAEEWLEVMHGVISAADKRLVLAGHSLGTRAALLYLEKYPDFFEHEIDLELVKSRAKEFVVLHSRDDDSIAFEQGGAIAEKLGATLVAIEGRGHFTEAGDAGVVFGVLNGRLRKKLNPQSLYG